MIARPAGRPRRNPVKPQAAKIELIDKNITHPHRIVITDPIFQPIGKQSALPAIHALDKTLHQPPRQSTGDVSRIGQDDPVRQSRHGDRRKGRGGYACTGRFHGVFLRA